MKTIGLAILLVIAHQELMAQHLVDFFCTPSSCGVYAGPLYSGFAVVEANGECYGGDRVFARGAVYANSCVYPVLLSAGGYPGYRADPAPDFVNGHAHAYNWEGTEYWDMFWDDFCDGTESRYIQPPTPC